MNSIDTILDKLEELHEAAVKRLRTDVIAFGRNRSLPPAERRLDGSYAYPELRLRYRGGEQPTSRGRAFGRLNAPGLYTTTITRPALFRDYLADQLELIAGNYEVEFETGASRQEIPFPYVLDGEAGAELAGVDPNEIARHFPSTELALIGDELADGIVLGEPDDPIPLSLFDALRTDFSLARLAHYTGTSPEHFQRFILFTNYHRYVDEFVDWAGRQLGANGCTALAGRGGALPDREAGQRARPALRHGVAAAPDARLSSNRRRARRDHAGQHRRRPIQRQDDLRPPRGAAARGVADDRPLRRPAPQPEDR